jgi:nucleotide-binding universal stress UspA family protein
MYRTILVPLDGSEFAEHALSVAASIACQAHANLQLVRAHSPVTTLSWGDDFIVDTSMDDRIRGVETAYLDSLVDRLKKMVPVDVTRNLINSLVPDALIEQAVAAHADLVVMATHGRGGFSRLWLGSMTGALLRRLPMPVLLVRPHEQELNFAEAFAPRRILIPLDGSELAEQILEPAIELGKLSAAEFTLLRVVEPFMSPLESANADLVRQFEQRNSVYLNGVAARLRDRQLPVKTRVILNRPAAAVILEEAHAQKADLIALATHGRGDLGRALLGSVADKVIRGSQVPVLVHRPLSPKR